MPYRVRCNRGEFDGVVVDLPGGSYRDRVLLVLIRFGRAFKRKNHVVGRHRCAILKLHIAAQGDDALGRAYDFESGRKPRCREHVFARLEQPFVDHLVDRLREGLILPVRVLRDDIPRGCPTERLGMGGNGNH